MISTFEQNCGFFTARPKKDHREPKIIIREIGTRKTGIERGFVLSLGTCSVWITSRFIAVTFTAANLFIGEKTYSDATRYALPAFAETQI